LQKARASSTVISSPGFSLNTVQLVDEDCAFGWLLWLRMVLVVKAFGGPFQDFAFDHARVGAQPACGVDPAV
jgi:hypothetical protein